MKKETVLIVDDTAANIEIVSNVLKEYDIIAVTNGVDAIEVAKKEPIDLILLDIMMPQMDGFELCEILKQEKRTQNTPIIFITAKTMQDDITKGFELGAVDYITKPFNPPELLARVKTHLELNGYKKQLQKRVQEEVEKNRFKQQLLFQHSKQAAIGELLMHIAHQWKQPISELGALNLYTLSKISLDQHITQEQMQQNCQKSEEILKFMSQTIETFQNFYKPSAKDERFDLKDAVIEASNIVNATFDYFGIKLHMQLQQGCAIYGNKNEYAQVILNLLNNAKDIFIKRKIKDPTITIKIEKTQQGCILVVEDNARGFIQDLNTAITPHISSTGSTGLGLYMSQAILEKNGASMQIENKNDGAVITIFIRVQ